MDLQKEYEKLYEHWLKEFQDTELTDINQKDFNDYKKILDFIDNYHEENKDELKDQILKSYRDNLNYLFNDFLKIREIKVINSALALKEINLDNVIEAEKLLYENLVSSIKGYKKVKAISLYEEEEIKPDNLIETKEEIKSVFEETPISKEKETSEILDTIKERDEEEINYILLRFLKKTPPLVGVDLINYGPFNIEDVAHLPQKNAKILIIEKFAEKIEIN
jgi:DNA replication initiation complex subunit (GINS family)